MAPSSSQKILEAFPEWAAFKAVNDELTAVHVQMISERHESLLLSKIIDIVKAQQERLEIYQRNVDDQQETVDRYRRVTTKIMSDPEPWTNKFLEELRKAVEEAEEELAILKEDNQECTQHELVLNSCLFHAVTTHGLFMKTSVITAHFMTNQWLPFECVLHGPKLVGGLYNNLKWMAARAGVEIEELEVNLAANSTLYRPAAPLIRSTPFDAFTKISQSVDASALSFHIEPTIQVHHILDRPAKLDEEAFAEQRYQAARLAQSLADFAGMEEPIIKEGIDGAALVDLSNSPKVEPLDRFKLGEPFAINGTFPELLQLENCAPTEKAAPDKSFGRMKDTLADIKLEVIDTKEAQFKDVPAAIIFQPEVMTVAKGEKAALYGIPSAPTFPSKGTIASMDEEMTFNDEHFLPTSLPTGRTNLTEVSAPKLLPNEAHLALGRVPLSESPSPAISQEKVVKSAVLEKKDANVKQRDMFEQKKESRTSPVRRSTQAPLREDLSASSPAFVPKYAHKVSQHQQEVCGPGLAATPVSMMAQAYSTPTTHQMLEKPSSTLASMFKGPEKENKTPLSTASGNVQIEKPSNMLASLFLISNALNNTNRR